MKRKIISWCIIAVLVLSYFGMTIILSGDKAILYGQSDGSIGFTEADNDITDMVIGIGDYVISENNNYILMLDSAANPKIKHKNSGRIWSGVPQEDTGNGKFQSAVTVTYYNATASETVLYSSESCVDKNQVKVYGIDNGVKVEYIFGEMVVDYIYPQMISKERMKLLKSKMSEEDAQYIESRYTYFELDSFTGENRKYLLKEYPRLEKEDLYILTDDASKRKKLKINEIFESIGYTKKDQLKDNGDTKAEVINSETMKIAVSYVLTDSGFKATVEEKDCLFYSEYPMNKVQLLPYFDCISKNEKGYFVLPVGSGSLLMVDDEREVTELEIPIYGENATLSKTSLNLSSVAPLPVFGQYKDNAGYLCVVDESEQQAKVVVDRNEYYSGASVKFDILDSSAFSMSSQNPVQLFAQGMSADEFSVEYILFPEMTNENAYSQMAVAYRERLVKNGFLKEKSSSFDTPFLAEIVNVINYDTTALGFVPVNSEFALTTFEQTKTISNKLTNFVDNKAINILLTGWNNNGLNRQKIGSIDFSKVAGGEKGYNELINYFEKNNINSYLDLNFSLVEPHSGDGITPSNDSARTINNNIVRLSSREMLTNKYKETSIQLISPKKFADIWKTCSSEITSNKIGIGVSALTSYLYGDYTDGTLISRGNAIESIKKVLESIDTKENRIIGDVGNLYTLSYLDIINNLTTTSDKSNTYDYDIPFVQMVLHGYIDYVTESMNSSDYSDISLLKLIETGSGLHYTLTANEFDTLFDTSYSYLYNTNYNSIMPNIERNYCIVNEALKGLISEKIISHTYLSQKVVCVTYENGSSIYVNYSDTDYAINGMTVKAMNFLRIDS